MGRRRETFRELVTTSQSPFMLTVDPSDLSIFVGFLSHWISLPWKETGKHHWTQYSIGSQIRKPMQKKGTWETSLYKSLVKLTSLWPFEWSKDFFHLLNPGNWRIWGGANRCWFHAEISRTSWVFLKIETAKPPFFLVQQIWWENMLKRFIIQITYHLPLWVLTVFVSTPWKRVQMIHPRGLLCVTKAVTKHATEKFLKKTYLEGRYFVHLTMTIYYNLENWHSKSWRWMVQMTPF